MQRKSNHAAFHEVTESKCRRCGDMPTVQMYVCQIADVKQADMVFFPSLAIGHICSTKICGSVQAYAGINLVTFCGESDSVEALLEACTSLCLQIARPRKDTHTNNKGNIIEPPPPSTSRVL